MKTLNEDIKNRKFKPAYLLYGEEDFLKRSYRNRFREAIGGEGSANYNHFEGKGIDVEELAALSQTLPFFGDRRLLMVESSGFFKSPPGMVDTLLGALDAAARMGADDGFVTFVFVESEVDRRGKLFKKVSEMGYAVELKHQGEGQLATWLAGVLAKDGKRIQQLAAQRLIAKVGDDMNRLRNEADKLVAYTYGRDAVTVEDVDAVCADQVENKVFDMVGAQVSGDMGRTMELYEDLVALREPPMRILFLLARQFNQIWELKTWQQAGIDRTEIASRLKVPVGIVSKISAQSRGMTASQAYGRVRFCLEMEEAVKTGMMNDRIALEMALTGDV
ncbi:MAG: DNA polymerase III subunit delta [Lachnospiraceae bacterium]|jgi:DNA polymerase-3 subunit delta|nr:DNA polymerase III subunit delta [Lachnospiraceae bacterium]